FTREGILEAVAKFITCDNQAIIIANKAQFQNCLVSMWLNTHKADLPTAYDMSLYIHNTFINHLQKLEEEIQVIDQTHLTKLDRLLYRMHQERS
ncbi:hypothetical protein BJV74DRAFT_774163, partial [Russula compacta]